MLIIILLIVTFNLTSSALVLPITKDLDAAMPSNIFGHELPECINVVHLHTVQDIILSCLATVFACTWVACHLDIPPQKYLKWRNFWESVSAMVSAILIPELVVVSAMGQWRGAVRHAVEYNKKHHGVAPPSSYLQWYICQDAKPGHWTITHGFLLEMDGLVDDSGKPICSVNEQILDPLDIPEREINDKSKGDFLTKFLVVFQTMWFMFQCLACWIMHLPVTELEVVTLAYATLNISTYSLWWNKPQSMDLALWISRYKRLKEALQEEKETEGGGMAKVTPVILSEVGSGESPDEMDHAPSGSQLSQQPRINVGNLFTFLWSRPMFKETSIFYLHFISHTLNNIAQDIKPLVVNMNQEHFAIYVCVVMIGTGFGGLHLLPLWLSSFPSPVDKFHWKICTILITLVPFTTFFLLATHCVVSYHPVQVMAEILTYGLLLLYVVARIILIVLAFAALHDLPLDVFRNIAWTMFIPHFQL